MAQVIYFQRPARLTRKAMQAALSAFGKNWYCKTVEGNAAFYFPESDIAFVPSRNDYQDFHMHLRCSDFNQTTVETPHNWH